MFLVEHFTAVLYVTGIITAAPLIMFIAPSAGLKALFKLEIEDEGGRFFARHWGMLCFVFGGLLVWAGAYPNVRTTIVLAALVEKVALVIMIAANWNEPYARGMRLTAVFDTICSLLYVTWLFSAAT
jgi:hypothetical protein